MNNSLPAVSDLELRSTENEVVISGEENLASMQTVSLPPSSTLRVGPSKPIDIPIQVP